MGSIPHKLLKSLISFSDNCVTLWNYNKIFELAILYSHDLIHYDTIVKLFTSVKWGIYTIDQHYAQNTILVDLHCFKSTVNFEIKIGYFTYINCEMYVFIVDIVGSLDELIKHGLRALRETLPQEVELTTKVTFKMDVMSVYSTTLWWVRIWCKILKLIHFTDSISMATMLLKQVKNEYYWIITFTGRNLMNLTI